jgi:AcrR family transcriptional regulator
MITGLCYRRYMTPHADSRTRILEAADRLLAEGGRDAVTTRAVCAAAGIQAPTLYRQFGDMDDLLDQVAVAAFDSYLAVKSAIPQTDDPVADLRAGWDAHIAFGLENPAHYLLMYGRPVEGSRGRTADRATSILRGLVERIAVAGRLTMPVDAAVHLLHAAGSGLTIDLIQTPPAERDLSLPNRMAEAVFAAITVAEPGAAPDLAARAVSLLAVLEPDGDLYSPGERALLVELLDRAAALTGGVRDGPQA